MSKININKFNQSKFSTVLVLTVGTVGGCFIGGFLLILSGIGIPLAAMMMTLGLFTAPLWALWRGNAGQKSAVRRTMAETGVELLSEENELNQTVQRLAKEAGLPPIKYVGWFRSDEINAFAMGLRKDNATICFTSGLLDKLTKDEVDAVAAHELGHVANGDMKRMCYAQNVQQSLTWIFFFAKMKYWARWTLTVISEWSIKSLSRSREYHADAFAAVLTSPEAMKSALRAIEGDTAKPNPSHAAHAYLMIRPNKANWFDTHPTVDERVSALDAGTYIRKVPTT